MLFLTKVRAGSTRWDHIDSAAGTALLTVGPTVSGDNWATCPRCLHEEDLRIAGLRQRAAEGYGVLPVEEFDALRAEAAGSIDERLPRTFREDYEIYGADSGKIKIRYSGTCNACGLTADVSYSEVFWPGPSS